MVKPIKSTLFKLLALKQIEEIKQFHKQVKRNYGVRE